MTREEVEEYVKGMTYSDAIYNALQGKGIPYRKATLTKLSKLIDVINNLPVTPTRKKGKWIEEEIWEDTDGGWGRWQKCSVCRQSKHHKTNFCPNCGAEMERE